MTKRTQLQIAFILALIVACALSAGAGEVRLRSDCTARSSVVTLGDIADLIDVSAEDRKQIETLSLFPAPQAGQERRVTAQDVREVMSLYGLSLPTVKVTGECRAQGTTSNGAAATEVSPVSLTTAESTAAHMEQLKTKLEAEIVAYLQTKDRIRCEWDVQPLLTAEQAQAFSDMQRPDITGGQAPWMGRQVFALRDRSAPDQKPLAIKADVSRVARALATTRSLAPGEIVRQEDVELAEVNPLSLSTTSVLEPQDVLGLEVKRAVPAGQLLHTHMVQKPILVKRGELVTVYCVAPGVQVKATAKSLAAGGLGDVVLLESPESNKRFQARVTAPQEAMVFVDTPTVAAEGQPSGVQKP